MKKGGWANIWAVVALGFWTFAATGFSYAAPGGVPPSGLPGNAPPFGLPASAPPFGKGPFGKGIGKGKGHAVARISYHCLGFENHIVKSGSSFTAWADSMVGDSAGEEVTLGGASTADLVVNDVGSTVPTNTAEASVATGALTMWPYDTCSTLTTSVFKSKVIGVSESDPSAVGAALVQIQLHLDATLGFLDPGDSENTYSTFTKATLKMWDLEESFEVRADGSHITAPDGVTITDNSMGGHADYKVDLNKALETQLFYGPGDDPVTNELLTTLLAGVELSGVDVEADGSTIVASVLSADGLTSSSLELRIVSIDPPDVKFTFVRPKESDDNSLALHGTPTQ